MFVKVCGIRTREQLDRAIELGYDAVGIICHEGSVRHVSADVARDLFDYARGKITSVAVGIEAREVLPFAGSADYLQCSEAVPGYRLIFASDRPRAHPDYDFFLYDSSRGSGKSEAFPSWLADVKEKLIIAGGLKPENVGEIIKTFRPFGVDVSSGVEHERGVKDFELMRQFIQEARHAAT